jgi:hypothetical protein
VKHRLNVFLPRENAIALAEIAAVKRVSKSSLVALALANFLSPEKADKQEALTRRRTEKLIREVLRLQRRQEVLIETLALFIRHTLATTVPVPDEQQEAARAQGRARFSEFLEQLGRHLQRGKSAFEQVYERLDASDADSYFQNGAGASS